MKGLPSRIVKSLNVGAVLTCADNSGAKQLQIISVTGFKGHRRVKPRAGVGNLVTCRVYKGIEKVRHQMFKVVIIRQSKEYRRATGIRISFEDNAGVIVDDKGEPKGTLIKGPVAAEAVARFSTIGKLASMVV